MAELTEKYFEFSFWQSESLFRLAFTRLFIVEKSDIVTREYAGFGASFHLWYL
ncbi:hypothetical protein [Nitrosovibrio sp. Nv4]|uniref:hypothetical protein n=1 Tax=Nitrosovibrio sp. Nv4 TaxID=1945880 RepID=UPI00135990B1|nr:hypothetical protein [Nitrosovibrio sp. Nv4]